MNLAPVADSFSFLQLFLQAHIVVKMVMIGLLLASVWSWAIIIEKIFAFRRARREADSFEAQFWSGQSLEELYAALARGRTFSMASLFVAAMREWKRSVEGNIRALGGIQMRVEKVMDVTISREMEQLDRRLLFLATVGSTAPFVGLFGTVWGIMSSFQAIAASKNTNLAIVAPGIAEALFATALGLLAAIPAVIFYNKFAADSSRLSQRLEAFADEFSAIVSRQIDVRSNRQQELGRWPPACRRARPSGGKRGRARRHSVMHEINVTPFVDVMLVLLIVFMVAAPLLLSGLPVDLPASKGQSLSQNKDPITVTRRPQRQDLSGHPGGAAGDSAAARQAQGAGEECRGRSDPVPRRPPGELRTRVRGAQRRARGRLQEVHLRQRPRGHRDAWQTLEASIAAGAGAG